MTAQLYDNTDDAYFEMLEDKNQLPGDRWQQTFQIVRHRMREKRLYRDLVFFILLYAFFLALVFLNVNIPKTYYARNALQEGILHRPLFADQAPNIRKDFDDVGQVDEMWQWLQGPFLTTVASPNAAEQGYVLEFNKILGNIRLRQLRLQRDACAKSDYFETGNSSTCLGQYSSDLRSEDSFGPKLLNSTTTNSTNHCASKNVLDGFCFSKTDAPYVYGYVNDWYDETGFVVDLAFDYATAQQQLQTLFDNNWIDDQSSALLIYLNVLNPHVDLFSTMTILFEFSSGGGVISSYSIRSFRTNLTTDTALIVCEIVFFVLLIVWTVYMLSELYSRRRSAMSMIRWFYRPLWNLLDVANKSLFIIIAVLYCYFIVTLESFLKRIDSLENITFESIESLSYVWVVIVYLAAGNILISTMTVFKYLNMNPRMTMMWKTLERATPDLVAFAMFFGLIFLTFVSLAHLMFGTKLENFRTYPRSIFACFSMLLGTFDFDNLSEKGSKYFAPLFFVAFMVLVTLILLNMFLAIIQDAYQDTQARYAHRPTLAVSLRRFVQRRALALRSCVGIESTVNASDSAGVHLSNVQIVRMLNKLDLRPGQELTREEIIAKLPNAPDGHITFISQLIADRDALEEVRRQAALDGGDALRAALHEEYDDDEGDVEDSRSGVSKKADDLNEAEKTLHDALARNQMSPPDLLRLVLDIEARLDRIDASATILAQPSPREQRIATPRQQLPSIVIDSSAPNLDDTNSNTTSTTSTTTTATSIDTNTNADAIATKGVRRLASQRRSIRVVEPLSNLFNAMTSDTSSKTDSQVSKSSSLLDVPNASKQNENNIVRNQSNSSRTSAIRVVRLGPGAVDDADRPVKMMPRRLASKVRGLSDGIVVEQAKRQQRPSNNNNNDDDNDDDDVDNVSDDTDDDDDDNRRISTPPNKKPPSPSATQSPPRKSVPTITVTQSDSSNAFERKTSFRVSPSSSSSTNAVQQRPPSPNSIKRTASGGTTAASSSSTTTTTTNNNTNAFVLPTMPSALGGAAAALSSAKSALSQRAVWEK